MTAVLSNVRFETPVVSFKLRDASAGVSDVQGEVSSGAINRAIDEARESSGVQIWSVPSDGNYTPIARRSAENEIEAPCIKI